MWSRQESPPERTVRYGRGTIGSKARPNGFIRADLGNFPARMNLSGWYSIPVRLARPDESVRTGVSRAGIELRDHFFQKSSARCGFKIFFSFDSLFSCCKFFEITEAKGDVRSYRFCHSRVVLLNPFFKIFTMTFIKKIMR